MPTKQRDPVEVATARECWQKALRHLQKEITDWSRSEGWQVHATNRILSEESVGTYTARDLVIEVPGDSRLHVEVRGRGPLPGAGRVELSAWPTLFRVFLLRSPDNTGWVIRTDSGVPIRQPWNRETFLTVASDLLDADE